VGNAGEAVEFFFFALIDRIKEKPTTGGSREKKIN